MAAGRKSREDRNTSKHSGVWVTSSQDYAQLAVELYAASKEAARPFDGNASAYAYAGIPLLFSALRAFLIECNSGIYGDAADAEALSILAEAPNELGLLRKKYLLDGTLLENVCLLYEVRNEISHPSPRPTGTKDSTPDYLRSLKKLGVLQTTGKENRDYVWMHQLQSHRLFGYTFRKIIELLEKIIENHTLRTPAFQCNNLCTYRQHERTDP